MNTQMTIEQAVGYVVEEAKSLVSTHSAVDINAEQNYAIQQLYKSDFNIKIAQQNPVSVQNAVKNLSSIGISLNPALKHAYLVPRDGQICLDITYMGLMHLAQQEGAILWGQARIVYAKDTYVNVGVDAQPKHEYNSFGDRGEKVGAYCVVKLPNGDFLTEEMSADEIQSVRNTSKAESKSHSPWNTFETEMWRKTVVKRASKYWPKSGQRLDNAIHVSNDTDGFDFSNSVEPNDIDKLANYASDKHTPIELYGFLESVRSKNGEDYYIDLYRRFPEGLKVSGKAKNKKGQSMFLDYLEIFKGTDELAKDEARTELTDIEMKMINKQLEIKEAA